MSITQKDLINEIREEQKRMAIEQLKLASNLSIFMNKQELFNQRVIDLLETNPLTKRKGIVEDLEDTKNKIETVKEKVESIENDIQSEKKSVKNMYWVASIIIGGIATIGGYLLNYYKDK